MSTSLHAVFDIVFGNVDFIVVIFNICGQKKRFSESSQNSMFEKSTFGHFEVLFFNVQSFPGDGVFLLAHSKGSVLRKR